MTNLARRNPLEELTGNFATGFRVEGAGIASMKILPPILLFLAASLLGSAAMAQPVERTGKQVVEAQCVKCHQEGKNGAPRIGDRDAWVQRMKQGVDNTVRSAIRGHYGMPPRGDKADLTDSEIRSAILYMFNPGSAK